MSEHSHEPRPPDNDVRWLALLIRQGLKLIVVGIERRYHLGDEKPAGDPYHGTARPTTPKSPSVV